MRKVRSLQWTRVWKILQFFLFALEMHVKLVAAFYFKSGLCNSSKNWSTSFNILFEFILDATSFLNIKIFPLKYDITVEKYFPIHHEHKLQYKDGAWFLSRLWFYFVDVSCCCSFVQTRCNNIFFSVWVETKIFICYHLLLERRQT